jgi:hypothetical protein
MFHTNGDLDGELFQGEGQRLTSRQPFWYLGRAEDIDPVSAIRAEDSCHRRILE